MNQHCSCHSLHEILVEDFEDIDENLKRSLQNDLSEIAPGLKILAVRVTKPTIPKDIEDSYIAMEIERTKLLVAEKRQKVVEKDAETERIKAVIEAEKHAQVSKILQEQKMMEMEAQQKINMIELKIETERLQCMAEAELYANERKAQANVLLFTREYLELKKFEAIGKNNKIYYGEKIPNIFVEKGIVN